MSSTLAQGAAGVPNYLSGSSPGRLERRVLSEERGKCYLPRPFCGYSRATPRGASHYLNCRRCQSTHLGHKRRWLSARCMSRKVSLVFSSSPPGVLFPGIVPRVNERRTGCFMPTRLSGGRVANPEGCPENPLRERLEQVGRHLRRTCRLALRTKDPGGAGSNCGSAARDGRSRSRPCRREERGWVQDPCRLGPWAPAPG